MPVIITITNNIISLNTQAGQLYDYTNSDKIVKNILSNKYEVYYSGQNKGFLDYQLLLAITNNDEFKIYYRNKSCISYTYLGNTKTVNVKNNRTKSIGISANFNERLKIKLVVDNNITNQHINNTVPTNNFRGSGKYKKDVLVHCGLIDINNNSIIEHNKNTNIGFYYY
jgi:hypothetical protein